VVFIGDKVLFPSRIFMFWTVRKKSSRDFWCLTASLGLLCSALTGWTLSAGCSDDSKPVCGNGKKEGSEECDCGSDPNNLPQGCRTINGAPRSTCSSTCTLLAAQYTTLNVIWTINGDAESGGSFDTCSDVDIEQVHIHTEGPNGFVRDEHVGCSNFQTTYYESNTDPLPAGPYTVTATPLSEGQPAAPPQQNNGVVQLDRTTDIALDFPLDAFFERENMTGDLLVKFNWQGMTCADASPVVVTESVIVSDEGEMLPGFPLSNDCSDDYIIENGLPAGEFTLHVEGLDSEDASAFCLETPVKIGAGGNAPMLITVPPLSAGGCP
jgi:hypothetical protein